MACAFPSISSTSDELEEILTCSICTNLFDRAEHRAKIFPGGSCQHTYCVRCLHDYANGRRQISCPACREDIVLPAGGVQDLPNSINVDNLLDYRNKRKLSVPCGNRPLCTSEKPGIRYCHGCGCFQCARCVEQHQIIQGLQHHRLISVDEMDKARPKADLKGRFTIAKLFPDFVWRVGCRKF